MPHIAQESLYNPSKVPPLFDVTSAEVREVLSPLVRYDRALYDVICAMKVQDSSDGVTR